MFKHSRTHCGNENFSRKWDKIYNYKFLCWNHTLCKVEHSIVLILMLFNVTILHILKLKSLVPWCFNGFVRITLTWTTWNMWGGSPASPLRPATGWSCTAKSCAPVACYLSLFKFGVEDFLLGFVWGNFVFGFFLNL